MLTKTNNFFAKFKFGNQKWLFLLNILYLSRCCLIIKIWYDYTNQCLDFICFTFTGLRGITPPSFTASICHYSREGYRTDGAATDGPFANGGRFGIDEEEESCWGCLEGGGNKALGPINLIIGVRVKLMKIVLVIWFIFETIIYLIPWFIENKKLLSN